MSLTVGSIGAKAYRKWLIAGIVLVVIALSLWHSDSVSVNRGLVAIIGTSSAAHKQSNVNLNEDISTQIDLPHLPERLKGKTLDLTRIVQKPLNLESDLHELENNDDYLPYLAAIDTVQNLTVPTAYGDCNFTDQELNSFVYNGDASWKINLVEDAEIQALREEWQHFIKHGLIPWQSVEHKYNGRGMVIVGGASMKEINRIKVALRAMKSHGSRMPIEINYYGPELQSETRKEFIDIYGDLLYFNDLADQDQPWGTFVSTPPFPGYQFKTAAMVNSRFEEILLLDSDNLPTSNPSSLFDSKVYQEYGAVFWPDFPRTRKENPAWAAFNTPCRRAEYEFETGQVLVDKRKYFYHLQLTAWMNAQPYWRELLLGDKDLFRYAWHALKTDFGTPVKWLTSLGFMAEQPDGDGTRMGYCGHTFGQAFPDHTKNDQGSGIAFLHGGALKTAGGPLLARLRKLKGGIFTHFKRVQIDVLEDWSQLEYGVHLGVFDSGFYVNMTRDYKPEDLVNADEDLNHDGKPIGQEGLKALELNNDDFSKEALCTDFPNVEALPISLLGKDAIEFESLFESSGGYWMLETDYHGW